MLSIFATRLKLIMDEGGLFNRQEWSQFCHRDEQVIENWLSDKAFPEPDILKMIVRVVSESDGMEQLLPHFLEMFTMPIGMVTPFAGRLDKLGGEDCWNLDDYLTIPLFKGFFRCFRGLSGKQMDEVLYKAAEHARSLRKPVPAMSGNEAADQIAQNL
jgi:hypothetical protein